MKKDVQSTGRWSAGFGRAGRLACGVGLVALGCATLPAACLFPEYSFNEGEGGGGGGTTGSGTGGDNAPAGSSVSVSGSASSSGAGGAGGQGGAASVSSSASSSSSGVGGATGEDCFNGSDDDEDDLADCADPDCDPLAQCVPAVPFGGWSGFAALFEGVPAQEPACPGSFPSLTPYIGHNAPSAGNPTCSACGCESPSGQTCNLPTEIEVRNKSCGMVPTVFGALSMPANWNGACWSPDGYAAGSTCNGFPCNSSVLSEAPVVSGGMCAPKGGQASAPPVTWAILGKACVDSAVGGGCGAGNVCQPKPPLPFLGGVCIYKAGDNACPAGEFSDKHVFYETFSDSRGCTMCTCGGPSGSTCTVSLNIYSDPFIDTCDSVVTTFNAGQCMNLNGNPALIGRKGTITQPPTGGSCPSTGGGLPTGTVTPTTPTTFCCTP